MTTLAIIVRSLITSAWLLLGTIFDLLRNLNGLWAGLIAAAMLVVTFAAARSMQKHLTAELTAEPAAAVSYWKLEWRYSLLRILLTPLILIGRALFASGQVLAGVVKLLFEKSRQASKKKSEPKAGDAESAEREGAPEEKQEEAAAAEEDDDEAAVAEAEAPEEEPDPPLLVTTLGPAFFIAGLATVGLYALATAVEPLLSAQLGLSPGYPAWQFVILGHRPELSWYLPLQRFPFLAGMVSVGVWLTLWWTAARVVRRIFWEDVGRNLSSEREAPFVLRPWRRWCAVNDLVAPVDSYLRWARWLPAVAVPFIIAGWVSLAGRPYRVESSLFAVAVVVWLAWVLHLLLRGFYRPAIEAIVEEQPEVRAKGWREVTADLNGRLQIVEPHAVGAPRAIDSFPLSEKSPDPTLISPLVLELLPPPRSLSYLQQAVLETLSAQAAIAGGEPSADLALGLAVAPAAAGDAGTRSPHQIVMAPEGAGKTTLTWLAACNHVLLHTRKVLVVTRDEAAAASKYTGLQALLQPSTLRWNVRARQLGDDLVNDLTQNIIPDLVICSLEQLVAEMLEEPATYAAFLANLGLVIVDDVESYSGPVEIHAQLAFRRLALRVRELRGAGGEGEETLFLILGVDGMHDTPAWVRTLCGVDAVARRFSLDLADMRQRERAEKEADGLMAGDPGEAEGMDAQAKADRARQGKHQLLFRLSDFRTAAGEALKLEELVTSCERLAVPWCFRPCGDGRRRLGRSLLHLREEPRFHVSDPTDAAVVILRGQWSEVRREIQRLPRAGARFSRLRSAAERPASRRREPPEPIALITVIDGDQEMALTQLDRRASLALLLETLPRPVVRAPAGAIVDSHLSAELLSGFSEVEDLLRIFDRRAADVLRDLSHESLLLAREQVEVRHDRNTYDEKLYVRALDKALAPRGGNGRRASRALAPRVEQVEHASESVVAIRDRTSLDRVAATDGPSSWHAYYPGRIFENAKGCFVVVGRIAAGSAEASEGKGSVADILVEPYLGDELSSPRGRLRLSLDERGLSRGEPVLLGDHPVGVGLQNIEAINEQIATFRIGPDACEVRQRALLEEQLGRRPLRTEALCLFPNPLVPGRPSVAPALRFRQARLIAAAMRSLLPTMYRGAEVSLAVGLHLEVEHPEPSHELSANECFVLYDLHGGGNGTAHAIFTDGVEPLLRLCRLFLERVIYHDRLRARFDLWGDRDEILGGVERADPGAAEESRQRGVDELNRHLALEWLDSRLRAEDGIGAAARVAVYGSGSEPGEGDVFDLGRCWYSGDESVASLLWCKHHWRLEDGGEAALDVGFDRGTADESRFLTQQSEVLEIYDALLVDHLSRPGLELPDGTTWGAPRAVWAIGGDEQLITTRYDVRQGGEAEQLAGYHSLASAVAAHSFPALEPLARTLRERGAVGDNLSSTGERLKLVSFLTRFVQGIPYSVPHALRGGLRPPINTLLYRLGDCDSKSLLLALLLKHCGLEAGLFVSFAERHAVAAVAAPPRVKIFDDERRGGESFAAEVSAWSILAGLGKPPQLWSVMPTTPSVGGEVAAVDLYVPVESTIYADVGVSKLRQPDSWAFLPLTAVWVRVGLTRVALPIDQAEFEVMS